jgi:hypothetical protein
MPGTKMDKDGRKNLEFAFQSEVFSTCLHTILLLKTETVYAHRVKKGLLEGAG